MKTILFQGDSITDCGRHREADAYMGSSYATMLAGDISLGYPGQYEFVNRGIGGNRSADLYARIRPDIINLKPDILTILIGVNDTWAELAHNNGISVENYENIYDMLIRDVKNALPQTKIIILEPFVLHGVDTDIYFDAFSEDVAKRQAVCRKLAEKHGLLFVPLQEMLRTFEEEHPGVKVVLDGVHPNFTGHRLIADALYDVLKPIL